jgi:threonine aldolase
VTVHHDPGRRDFTSDNCASVHPTVLAAIGRANGGHQPGYGADVYTERLREVIRSEFGPRAQVYPVFNGTGANVVALQAMAGRWEGVACAESAHLHTDECGAPEHHGLKLVTLPSPDGRIDPDALSAVARDAANRHHPQVSVVSITQSTELGTCYGVAELGRLTEAAHRVGFGVHLDGARLANAAASLGCSLRDLTTDAGIDVVSLGLTKNGGLVGDCIVVLNPDRVRGLPYLKKACTQLPSKSRFISAQALALLAEDLWLRNADHANEMARELGRGLADLPEVRIVHPVEANAVFASLPESMITALRGHYEFATWDVDRGVVRLMTAFDTEPGDVRAFLATAARAAGVSLDQPVDATQQAHSTIRPPSPARQT